MNVRSAVHATCAPLPTASGAGSKADFALRHCFHNDLLHGSAFVLDLQSGPDKHFSPHHVISSSQSNFWCVPHLQLAELRPQTPSAKARVSFWALVLTSCLFLLITMGSYAVFGTDVQSDVLHNFTPRELRPFLGRDLGTWLYIAVRLSFMISVLSLFPIMVRLPADTPAKIMPVLPWQIRHAAPIDQAPAMYKPCLAVRCVSVMLLVVAPGQFVPVSHTPSVGAHPRCTGACPSQQLRHWAVMQMFPARDGLLRLTIGRESPSLSDIQFYSVSPLSILA